MTPIENLFNKMDNWRHLPNYQLERRADLFFALYLPEVINRKLPSLEFDDNFIPEFPVKIGTIYPNIPTDKSYKIDYVGVSRDGKTAVLVELKTENLSRRESQDNYLLASRNIGFEKLVHGIIQIFRATNYKQKYFHLLKQLEALKLISIPTVMNDKMFSENIRGINSLAESIEITSQVEKIIIVYIQPNGDGDEIINFHEFSEMLKDKNDAISQRFAQSLLNWTENAAGTLDVMDREEVEN